MSSKNNDNQPTQPTNTTTPNTNIESMTYSVAINSQQQSCFIDKPFIKKIKIDNIKKFEKFLTENIILNCNVAEEIKTDYSRIFLDVDMHDTENDKSQLNKLKSFILHFMNDYNLKCYGYFDIKDQAFKEMFDTSFKKFGFITVVNNTLTDRILSGHISFNGYQERNAILSYLEYYINDILYQNNNITKIIDTSVIKKNGKRQLLRAVFSAKPLKVIDGILHLREFPKENIPKILNNKEYIYNIRMTPTSEDILINFPPIPKKVYTPIPKPINVNTNIPTNIPTNNTNTPTQIQQSPNHHISIFQYLHGENITPTLNNTASHELMKQLFQLSKSILTPNEFMDELKSIIIPEVYPDDFIPWDQWFDKVAAQLKIYQDFENPAPIYNLISLLSNKRKELEKQENYEENVDYINIKQIIKRLFKYLGKYSKLIFVAAKKYDFNDMDNDYSKIRKLSDNVYSILNDNQYYYPYNDEFYTPAEFKRYFKLSGTTITKFNQYITIYKSHQEYQRCKAAYLVSKLTSIEREHYISNIQKFINIFHDSFVYDDDFKYYLSYFALKLQSNASIRKGLINQGTFTSPAINSFKTLFNEMINNYSVVKQANVNNINKELNGTYFIGDLLIIEELPKKIKNIDNLLNIFREYSNKRTITVEEKGMRPYEITNKCDYIINTNHTTEEMFKDHNDAEGLLKRFRIIIRKSITITKEVATLLDDMTEHNNIYQYFLRDYLINTVTDKYFKEHKDEYNSIMKKYLATSSDKTTLDKATINLTLSGFIENFHENYMDKDKRLKLNKFREYLIKAGVLKLANAKTLKQKLMLILTEGEDLDEDNKLIKLNDNGKVIVIKDDKAIEIIYNTYFEFDEEILIDTKV